MMPIRRPVVGGFSASGASIGPFVDIPGIDRRMLIADGKPANSEDLIVLWTLGLPYGASTATTRSAGSTRFGELPDGVGLGYTDPPRAQQPEHELGPRARRPCHRGGDANAVCAVAVAVVDGRGDPIQLDTMDGAPTAGPFVAEAVAAAAATFGCPSHVVGERYSGPGQLSQLAAALPYRILTAPGGLPIHDGDRVAAGLGIAGPPPTVCAQIAQAVLAAEA